MAEGVSFGSNEVLVVSASRERRERRVAVNGGKQVHRRRVLTSARGVNPASWR